MRDRLNVAYWNMKKRCYDTKSAAYKNYGERGIVVCDEWNKKGGYQSFKEWAISSGYKDNLSLDRIDVDGNYCPENCRWVDNFTQANNTRKNHYVIYNGKKTTISELSRISDIPIQTILSRLKNGNSVEMAISKKRLNKKNGSEIQLNGITHSYAEWSRITGIDKVTIRKRIVEYGWSIEDALSIKPHKRNNKHNNSVTNLEWVTDEENKKHRKSLV